MKLLKEFEYKKDHHSENNQRESLVWESNGTG